MLYVARCTTVVRARRSSGHVFPFLHDNARLTRRGRDAVRGESAVQLLYRVELLVAVRVTRSEHPGQADHPAALLCHLQHAAHTDWTE
jgi:hypothetical protein